VAIDLQTLLRVNVLLTLGMAIHHSQSSFTRLSQAAQGWFPAIYDFGK
jgi:hypothetical protein